jgi:xanthine/CO dehydrogenase XdhC/CoxF family maturation factor
MDVMDNAQEWYFGAMGGRRAQEARRERLTAAGFDESASARICAPMGAPSAMSGCR